MDYRRLPELGDDVRLDWGMGEPYFFDARRRRHFERIDGAPGHQGDLHRLDSIVTPLDEHVEHFQQYFRGLPVYGGAQTVVHHGNTPTVTGQTFAVPQDTVTRPSHSVSAAVKAVEGFMRARRLIPARARLAVVRHFEDASLPQRPTFAFMSARVDGPLRAHLELCPVSSDRVRLAWVMTWRLSDRRRFHAVVTAAGHAARVIKLAQVNACAFPGRWTPTPHETSERLTWPRPTLDTPSGVPSAPTAWQATAGLASGPNVVCVHPYPRTVLALDDGDVDNIFIWTNLLHDFCRAFGFDHQSWAFEGIDRLEVVRLREPSNAAGDFDNFADGASPEMRLFASPYGGRHAAADPSIVIHEYFHGVCSRLVGGAAVPEPFTTREAQGVVEGLCDYFAITILNKVARGRPQATPVTGIGTLFQPATGLRNYAGAAQVMPKKIPKDIYRTGQIWCAAVLEGRGVLAATRGEDHTDRFVWSALFSMLRRLNTSAPPSNSHFTLMSCRATLATAGAAVELKQPAMAGATAILLAAMAQRNV